MRTRGVRPCSHVRMFACSCRIPASPLEAVLNRRIIACSGTRTTAVFARKTSLYLFSAKSTDRSLRLASRSPRNAARKVRILACSGTRTTDSPRARSGRLHSLVLAAPAQRGPEVVPAKSDMRMVLVLLTSLRSFSSFWHGITRKRSLLVLRASVDIKSTEKAATMSRVFCTFFPQKGTQKLPGRCLRIRRAVLTLAPGARLKGGF